jgi:hypothetical protein
MRGVVVDGLVMVMTAMAIAMPVRMIWWCRTAIRGSEATAEMATVITIAIMVIVMMTAVAMMGQTEMRFAGEKNSRLSCYASDELLVVSC